MNSYKKREKKGSYSPKFRHSVNAALEGVVHTLKSERNMRIHFLVAFLVLSAGIYFNLDAVEFLTLLFAVSFVLVSEMFNTAIECTLDLVKTGIHPEVKIIKDIAAGAVFVSVVNAMLTGYILFSRRLDWRLTGGFSRISQSHWGVTLIVLLSVVAIVLFTKILRKEDNLLWGGMPSGHSAVAFAVWVIVSFFSRSVIVCILVFFLAFLVARSRLVIKAHNLFEIIVGCFIGALVALLLIQLLF